MTVSELIKELSNHDPDMEVYAETPEDANMEIETIDYELYSAHGYYRGVYFKVKK